jgi:hypothetical protein
VRDHRQRTVVIAVVAVWMMQAAVHQIVYMIAMRHSFVATTRPVPMRRLVTGRVILRIAAVRIAVAHGNHMMLGAATLGMLKATVIEIIGVAFVPHGEMAASGAMNVGRSLTGSALFGCHGGSSVVHPQSSARIMPKLATGEKRTSRRLLAVS